MKYKNEVYRNLVDNLLRNDYIACLLPITDQ